MESRKCSDVEFEADFGLVAEPTEPQWPRTEEVRSQQTHHATSPEFGRDISWLYQIVQFVSPPMLPSRFYLLISMASLCPISCYYRDKIVEKVTPSRQRPIIKVKKIGRQIEGSQIQNGHRARKMLANLKLVFLLPAVILLSPRDFPILLHRQ